MDSFINFIGRNYSWFLTISIVLIFALIGYIYDNRKSKNDLLKKNEEENYEKVLENIVVPEGKGLAETVNVSKNINPETKRVELTDSSILEDEVKEDAEQLSP